MRPVAAWLAVLATLCLLLSTVHLGAITGDKPHGFGHWQPHLQQPAPEDGAPKDDHHDDLPAKQRRVQLRVVTHQTEPMPAPASFPPIHAIAPVLQNEALLAQAPPRVPDQWPVRIAPPRQRHRGQAPPALHC